MIPLIVAGIGALASAAGGAIGNAMGAGDRARQRQLLEQVLAQYGTLDVPTLKRIAVQELGPSALEGVQGQMDPHLGAAQNQSLDALGQVASSGDTAETRAAMSRILGDVARQESAGRNATMSSARARGISGSGVEMAAALSNDQAAANRAQQGGLDQAAAAQKRMLDAIMGRGQMAGQMRSEQYHELSDAARAKDLIGQYNATARTNADQYNNQLAAQNYGMQLQKINGMANAAGQNAAAAGAAADRAGAMGAGIGSGINQAAQGVAGQMQRSTDTQGQRDFLKSLYGSGSATPAGLTPPAPATASGTPYYVADPTKDPNQKNWWES